jgi:hypothetical protein
MSGILLQFVTERGGWPIRWFTHSDFSHVDFDNGGWLYGARLDGVWARGPEYARFTHTERVVIPASGDERLRFTNFLSKQIGKPYDWRAIVGFAFNRNWRHPDSWFCSELIAAALEHANIVRFATPANRITPNDLYLVASTLVEAPDGR